MNPASMPQLNPSSTSFLENTPSGGISSIRPGRMGLARDPSTDSNVLSPTGGSSGLVGVASGDQANTQVYPPGISYLASTYTKTTTQSMPTNNIPINPIELIKPLKRKHGRRGMRNQKRRLGRT
ncbi:uncharacterized protein MELLADRAFT_104521 [Melampsora larici-populina 98AG31]|uniref:Uncharacterized protein n=1 Tax=Melampsora larici-populina (strain 98AG31 / pathotype 3-4-7) TaxID=747676 RepID=F4REZ0_MELLP|nr:uncharacterized protein MELLADRAFT_104521 [Melampsora larici-populina 98AG31]EGG09191.1 hypothetical protein MELLADRAFT_104521 [Melampsora larici-populina 98AG31]